MANEEKSKVTSSMTQIVGIVRTIGVLSSLVNFTLNLLDLGEESTFQLTWFQLLPFGAFPFAFLHATIDYEMRRDKWPSRLKELARSVAAISVIGPEDAGEDICRPVVEIYKVYYRMALAEGKKYLAKDLKKDIDGWQKGTT